MFYIAGLYVMIYINILRLIVGVPIAAFEMCVVSAFIKSLEKEGSSSTSGKNQDVSNNDKNQSSLNIFKKGVV